MRILIIGVALIAATVSATAQDIRPFEPEPFDWRQLSALGYYGSRDCTRDRSHTSAARAIEVCSQYVQTNAPRLSIARALLVRGDRYEDLGDTVSANADYERAVALYTEEINEAPRIAGPYAGRSDAYYSLNRFQEALADLDRAISIDDALAGAHYRRAIVHFRLGNYTDAVTDYDRTASLGERMASRGSLRGGGSPADRVRLNPAITASRCEARAAAGVELDIARNLCRDAMRSSRERFAFSRGFLRFKQGDFEGAWEDFNTTAESDETNGYAIYARGVAAVRLGRQIEGAADITRGHTLEGEDLAYYARAGLRP
jgi:tetratricopeptide (TPR) repeat protein